MRKGAYWDSIKAFCQYICITYKALSEWLVRVFPLPILCLALAGSWLLRWWHTSVEFWFLNGSQITLFFFFWKRPSINTGRKNENKENTSAYPVAYKLTKQECRRKAKLTSFSQRQGAQVPSLSTQKNAVNMASIFHPIAIPASWAISAVFLVNQLTELYRMPLCQHRCRSCWRDSERKDVWKRVPGHSIYLFIHLFIHLIFIEHLLTLNHCAKVLRICGEIE